MDTPPNEIINYLLPSDVISMTDHKKDNKFDECVICVSCSENDIVSLECKHKFHKDCIQKWIQKTQRLGPTCPMCRHEIVHKDKTFWFKLGRETCNLRRWSWYCYSILQQNFGKSSEYTKNFDLIHTFISIQGKLDSILMKSYRWDEDSSFAHSLMEYIGTDKPMRITDVFYNIGNFEPPPFSPSNPIPLEGKKFRKTLTTDQVNFINAFKLRLNNYIEYLKFIKENIERPTAWDRVDWPHGVPSFVNQSISWTHELQHFDKSIEKIEKKSKKLVVPL